MQGKPRKEEAGPGSAHLLEEADVENGECAVEKVEEREEPAFVQRLAGETGGRAVSLPLASGQREKQAFTRGDPPNQRDPWGGSGELGIQLQ